MDLKPKVLDEWEKEIEGKVFIFQRLEKLSPNGTLSYLGHITEKGNAYRNTSQPFVEWPNRDQVEARFADVTKNKSFEKE